jgi:hypothetical protein
MNRLLPLLSLVLTLLGVPPAGAQYMFFDTNGNQQCDPFDFVWGTDVPIDVYLDTNHNLGGILATCPTGEDLSMSSYELIFVASLDAPVVYGTWTNAVTQFGTELGRVQDGNYLRVGFSGPTLPPGKYRLGTLVFTSSPCTFLGLGSSMPASADYFTGFTSACTGTSQDNTMKLGRDFTDFCMGNTICDDVKQSTWGAIKNRYR